MPYLANEGTNFAYSGGAQIDPGRSAGLAELYSDGCRRVRIVHPIYTTETANVALRDNLEATVLEALDQGFTEVIYGYTANGDTLTATKWDTYAANVELLAARLNALEDADKIILCLGNEDDSRVDGTTLTTATFQSNIRALSVTIHATYPNLRTLYTCLTAYSADWRANSGELDFVGLNVYSTRHTFHSQVIAWRNAHGIRGIITEWGPSDNNFDDWEDDDLVTDEIFSRKTRMNTLGMTHYWYSFDNSGGGQQWPLRLTNGTDRKAMILYKEPRISRVDTYKYPTVFGE